MYTCIILHINNYIIIIIMYIIHVRIYTINTISEYGYEI